MKEPRRAWTVSGVALVSAAITGAAAVSLWWLPCRGQMLLGTPLDASTGSIDPTDACIARMGEGTPFPLPTTAALSVTGLLILTVATIALVAVAWLVPVLREPVSGIRRLVAALPGCATLGVAALAIGIAYDVPGAEAVAYPLTMVVSLLVVSGFAVLLGHVSAWRRYLVAALALSTMGFAGPVVEYLVMASWSELNWDAPPGSGYLTSAVLFLCGIAVSAMARTRSGAVMAEPAVPAEAGR